MAPGLLHVARMKRWLVILLALVGCSHGSLDQLGAAAVTLAAAATAEVITGGVGSASREESRPPPEDERDADGRTVRLRRRVYCPGGRSYKLLCADHDACFFETNDGRVYDVLPANQPPPSLRNWCAGSILPAN